MANHSFAYCRLFTDKLPKLNDDVILVYDGDKDERITEAVGVVHRVEGRGANHYMLFTDRHPEGKSVSYLYRWRLAT